VTRLPADSLVPGPWLTGACDTGFKTVRAQHLIPLVRKDTYGVAVYRGVLEQSY